MKEKKSNIGKYLLILVPFVMGVTGFTVLDGQPVVDSLFLSMEMYFLNYSDSPPNILIEIARWTAPLMTASGVLMSISKIRMKEQDDVIFANCTIISSCFCAIYEKMYGDRWDSLTEKTASAIIKT